MLIRLSYVSTGAELYDGFGVHAYESQDNVAQIEKFEASASARLLNLKKHCSPADADSFFDSS